VRSVELLHATDRPSRPPQTTAEKPGALVVTRRLDADSEALRKFILEGGPPEDWVDSQDNATEPVFGGAVVVAPATTSGLLVRLTAAALAGTIDDAAKKAVAAGASAAKVRQSAAFFVHEDGRVELPVSTLDLLKIEGLPEPESGRRELRTERLEELQARSYGPAADMLQVQRLAGLTDGGARRLTVQVVGLPRHAARLLGPMNPAERDSIAGRLPLPGKPQQIWLPATRRPAPADVHSLQPTFSWSEEDFSIVPDRGFVKRIERKSYLRLYLRRPWYGSGEGERVGIVIWPPEILRSGSDIEDLSGVLSDLVEEDLGPAGSFVSAWGLDPIRAWTNDAKAKQPIFIRRDSIRASENPALWHPRVLMPVVGAEKGSNSETFAQVSLISYEPRFHISENLWFVDIHVDVGLAPDPFIRLGVVRFQPHAREDREAEVKGESRAIRCSAPSVAWAQVMPVRRFAVTWVRGVEPSKPMTQVAATLSGPAALAQKDPKPSPAVRFRVVQSRSAQGGMPAQEIQALGVNGKPLLWESWRGQPNGNQKTIQGEATWTAVFHLTEEVSSSDGTYSVIAEEFDRMPSASSSDGTEMSESGTRFFGRIDLTKEKTKTV
jgi:hypothetical protein